MIQYGESIITIVERGCLLDVNVSHLHFSRCWISSDISRLLRFHWFDLSLHSKSVHQLVISNERNILGKLYETPA